MNAFTQVIGARPIQPSMRRELAQQLAYIDPRCEFPEHNYIAVGHTCQHCHLDLAHYLDTMVPQVWA